MMDVLGRWLGLSVEPGQSDLSEESDGTLLQVAGQVGPDRRKGEGRLGRRRRTAHGGPSRKRGWSGASWPLSRGRRIAGISAGWVRQTSLAAQGVNELGHL